MKGITDDLTTVAYIGDDINDFPCLKLLNKVGGLTGCPADAVADVKMICDFKGADGAVREFVEWLVVKGRKK